MLNITEKAINFKLRLNETFSKIWDVEPFYLEDNSSYIIKSNKVALNKNNNSGKLYGDFFYSLSLDRDLEHLAVYKSCFRFFLNEHSEPLFRFEFRKENLPHPSAHFHIHLDKEDNTSVPFSELIKSKKNKNKILSKVHFPLGGGYFRPCLEDVLLTLNEDMNLGLSLKDKSILLEEMQIYRKNQAKAAYREHLEEDYGLLTLLKDKTVF